MLCRRKKFLIAMLLLSCGGCALSGPTAAQAAPFQSQVTAPAAGSVFLHAVKDSHTSPLDTAVSDEVTYTGTTGSPNHAIDVRCVQGNTSTVIASATTDNDGAFTVTAPAAGSGFCSLRATPAGSNVVVGASGPTVFFATTQIIATNGITADYKFSVPLSPTTSVALASSDSTGLSSLAHDPDTDIALGHWSANGNFTPYDLRYQQDGLRVDGHNAIGATWRAQLAPTGADAMPLTVQSSWDRAAQHLTVNETDPIALCNTDTFPLSTGANCNQARSSGVTMERHADVAPLTTAGFDARSTRVTLTDTWRSTDRSAHKIALNMNEQYTRQTVLPGPGFAFLWSANPVALLANGSDVVVPSPDAPRSWVVQSDFGATDSAVNMWSSTTMWPQPTQLQWSNGSSSDFQTVETFDIPAAGTVVRKRVYTLASTQAQAQTAALSNEELVVAPTVLSTTPARTQATTVTVTGSVQDPGGHDQLTVAGQPATLTAAGTFAVKLPAAFGKNTWPVVATDSAGQTATASVVVTRIRPRATTTTKQARFSAKSRQARVPVRFNGTGIVKAMLLVRRGHRKVTLATGKASFKRAGRRTVKLKLTRAGRRAYNQPAWKRTRAQLRLIGKFPGVPARSKTVRVRVR